MPTWGYDSYCNNNVTDFIDDYSLDKFLEIVDKTISNIFVEANMGLEILQELDLEFVIGIAIFAIRHNKKFSNNMLNLFIDIIDFLIKEGKFNGWKDKNKRKIKLQHEKKIIQNILIGRNLTFGKLILKPIQFICLNHEY